MAIISGVYANGLGEPVVGVQLVLTARVTSSGVVMTTVVEQKTVDWPPESPDNQYNLNK
ncbi:prophage tail fiber N-terminal domain-containing protein [Shigella dysenteriae]|uniref:prophage tail fiber N-terminal domain-containing protein n=1 Tax=Shigella dysenteriae TaxID=622 RepID=UPI001F31D863|nr:prophage tail fiber N-terminal domain-containing protein [Shigella dysenteriae]